MNYLAHAFLSNNNADLLIGNFVADHIRGSQLQTFSPNIREGIFLHRRIDTFTDSHPEFKKSKRLFYDGFEKHSGILIDIYFDHFLAKNFNDYHTLNLGEFSADVYKIYLEHQELLPQGSSRFLEYVVKNNIYVSYSKIEGIQKVLYHLSQRIKHNVLLDASVPVLQKHEQELQENFKRFFEDAQREFLR